MQPVSQQPSLSELYDECGVVRVQGILPGSDMSVLTKEVEIYIRDVAPRLGKGFVFHEPGTSVVRSLHWMNAHSEFFAQLCQDQRLRSAVSQVSGWEAVPHYVELFAKPAAIGGPIVKHQEEPYLFLDPPHFATLWLALDPVDQDNGAVQFYIGSHLLGVLPHVYGDAEGSLLELAEEDGLQGLETIGFDLEPGDATIHHPRTVHFSEPNRSGRRRMGLGFVYRSPNARMDEQRSTEFFGMPWSQR